MFSVDDVVLDAMDEMTREGIQFALGDVGAGNNSLRYHEGMDFTFASISHDLTLCHNGELPHGKTLSALLELGRTLNVTLIAEGIQNDEHAGLLTTKGFRLLQGYADAHPLSASHFISQCLRVPCKRPAKAVWS
ncbi:hypothetical protein VL10_09335 [Leclercia adecarboxylata]|nr:hypothetical protein VL10_09335 [Leclercia adecarboxylata]KMN61748.1 hypothetical protein VK95_23005 [Leclercia sp. LK8]